MPQFSASITIDESPERIWRTVMALEAWPEWSPLFQMVQLHDPGTGIAGGFTAHGLLGRIPYRAEFMVPDYEPLRRFLFQAVTISPPCNTLWHDIQLDAGTLTWSTSYTLSAGPGGWAIDRLMVRRQARDLLERGLEAFARQIRGEAPE